jgi:hypothetical protein
MKHQKNRVFVFTASSPRSRNLKCTCWQCSRHCKHMHWPTEEGQSASHLTELACETKVYSTESESANYPLPLRLVARRRFQFQQQCTSTTKSVKNHTKHLTSHWSTHTHTPTHKQTHKQTSKHRNKQACVQASTKSYKHSSKQTNKQTSKQANKNRTRFCRYESCCFVVC